MFDVNLSSNRMRVIVSSFMGCNNKNQRNQPHKKQN